jgi:hypothetical protein
MILKNKEIVITEENPFLNDQLGRKESAEALTEFVSSCSDPLVVCIDAPWGQGKTTFLKMWKQHLINSGFYTIYFNAWENDFSEDALVSLVGEISSSIEERNSHGEKNKAKEYLDKAKKLGAGLLKQTISIAAKVATAGALDLDKVTEQALSSFAESFAKEQLEKYEKSKKTLKAFRDVLRDLAKSLSNETETEKPLVFIIDELDRCRPSFAIEVLEKAKHFFNVENIVFVLAADKQQLGHSIRSIYGADLDVNGYLRRFIDFDYILPAPKKGKFVNALFIKYNFNSYFSNKTGSETRYEGEQALKMFSELFEIFKLSLREQEHCCSLLSLAIRTTPENYKLFPLFLCFLIVLKVKDPDTYKNLLSGSMSLNELLIYASSTASELMNTNYGTALEAYIVACKDGHNWEDITRPYKEKINSSIEDTTNKERATRILRILESFDFNGGTNSLGYLIRKIEIASRFEAI